MIDETRAKKYCYEDISKIENYDKAVADQTQTWHCHHRWETDRNLSTKELKFCSEYCYVPADRLIFLTKSEHSRLHMSGENNPNYGKHFSDETKEKMSKAVSEALSGRHLSDEHKRNLSKAMSRARCGCRWWNNGKVQTMAKECPGPEWKQGRTFKTQFEVKDETGGQV